MTVTDGAPQLDLLPAADLVDLLLRGHERALPAVRSTSEQLAAAAELLAAAVRAGGCLAFAGAGTSGRLAAAEAAELPGTFGLPASRCISLLAGAATADAAIDDSAEDDAAAGEADVCAAGLGPGDVLVAVAASGTTPYTLAAARTAQAAGARVVAVVTSTGSPLARLADVGVETETGPEVLRGSTRLAAGTAQKVALNTMTTAAMALAGRVHGNLMVDVVAANTKLRARAAGVVAEIAGCPLEAATAALAACGDDARAAVIHLVRNVSPGDAIAAAARYPSLRAALEG